MEKITENLETIKILLNTMELDKDELKSIVKEIKEELDDGDYSSDDELESDSDDELEKECIEETLKVNIDEKLFMSLDLEFKSSSTNKDECE